MDGTQTYTVVDTLESEQTTRQDSSNQPFMTKGRWLVVKIFTIMACLALVTGVVVFLTRNTWKRPSDVADFLEEKEGEKMLQKSEVESKEDEEKRRKEKESLLR